MAKHCSTGLWWLLFHTKINLGITLSNHYDHYFQSGKKSFQFVRRLVKSMGWEVQPSCTWCRHSFATNLTHAGVPQNYISESMGHSVDSNITNRYIDAFPLAQQMEFNSRILKLNDDVDILEELKGLRNPKILGNSGKMV